MKIEEARKIVRLEDALEYCKKQSMLEQVVSSENWKHYSAAADALEKQIPKHYELWNNQCSCPNCNKLFGSYDQLKTLIHWEMPYCKFCGQALIWSNHPTEKGGGE